MAFAQNIEKHKGNNKQDNKEADNGAADRNNRGDKRIGNRAGRILELGANGVHGNVISLHNRLYSRMVLVVHDKGLYLFKVPWNLIDQLIKLAGNNRTDQVYNQNYDANKHTVQ